MMNQCVAQVWPRYKPLGAKCHPHRCSRAAVTIIMGVGHAAETGRTCLLSNDLCRQHLVKAMRHGVVKHYKTGRRIEKGVK